MQLAPIAPLQQLRADSAALAAAADRLDDAMRAPYEPGAPVTGAVATRLAAAIAAGADTLRHADAAATGALAFESDTFLGVEALQLREGIEEYYDSIDQALDALRETVADGTIANGPGIAGPRYDLRRAAVILRGFGTDMVETIDARTGAAHVSA